MEQHTTSPFYAPASLNVKVRIFAGAAKVPGGEECDLDGGFGNPAVEMRGERSDSRAQCKYAWDAKGGLDDSHARCSLDWFSD